MNCGVFFEKFYSNLITSKKHHIEIKNNLEQITEIINFEYWNKKSSSLHSIIVDSYAISTNLDDKNINVLVELPWYMHKRYSLYGGNGPLAILDDVNKKFRKFLKSSITLDCRKIKIDFEEDISFKVIPVFLNEDGSYTYPDPIAGGSFKITNPRRSIYLFNKLDRQMNGNLKIFVKMIKIWNENWNLDLEEALIDAIVYEFFEDYKIGSVKNFMSYDWYTRDFFEYMIEKGPDYYWYIPGTDEKVMPKSPYLLLKALKKSLVLAEEAMELQLKDYKLLSRDKWIEIYGEIFAREKPLSINGEELI